MESKIENEEDDDNDDDVDDMSGEDDAYDSAMVARERTSDLEHLSTCPNFTVTGPHFSGIRDWNLDHLSGSRFRPRRNLALAK